MDDRTHALGLAAGTLVMAAEIAEREKDEKRRDKMLRVVDRKWASVRDSWPEVGEDAEDALAKATGDWEEKDRVRLLIDLDFAEPFIPYELKYVGADKDASLEKVAWVLGLGTSAAASVRRTRRDAIKAHRRLDWTKIGVYGVGGAVLVGTLGFFAAPLLGGALGAGAGLGGAAAAAHGLALLGGGSLAMGGAGMAGGLWLVTGVGAAAGVIGGGGSTALLQLGAAQAKIELLKLQINYKLTILDSQMDTIKAQEVISSLAEQQEELRAKLDEEKELNDRNAGRVKEVEETLQTLGEAVKWMQAQTA